MAQSSFFPPRPESRPVVYAYSDSNPQYDGQLKVGYTTRTARQRLDDIYNIRTPGPRPYEIVLEESAMRQDGTAFTDKDVRRYLKGAGLKNAAVELTSMYFNRWRRQAKDKPPYFLWNVKMRSGKTFAAYQLAGA